MLDALILLAVTSQTFLAVVADRELREGAASDWLYQCNPAAVSCSLHSGVIMCGNGVPPFHPAADVEVERARRLKAKGCVGGEAYLYPPQTPEIGRTLYELSCWRDQVSQVFLLCREL